MTHTHWFTPNTLEPFIAESPSLKEIERFLHTIAPATTNLFLTGECGTGKTRIAQRLHTLRNKKGAFIAIPCGSFLPADFCLSKAFSSAQEGTLFFSEIHLLPKEFQAELLKELAQNKEESPHSVQIVSASSAHIERFVEDGSFLEDLYYTLSPALLHIPPLKERVEDILPLANLFLKRSSLALQKPYTSFSKAAQEALCTQSWKQNALELEALVQYACIVATPPQLELKDLPLKNSASPAETASLSLTELSDSQDKSLRAALNVFKKQYLEMILQETNGNKTAAARILDVQRTYVSKLISKYNIKPKD